ncbi:MAG: rhodanese-like domain-containing protein [Myxococcota bacterium]
MEWEATEVAEQNIPQRGVTRVEYDPNVIPRVVDGSGDTPGPKHATNIGRTWVASQVISDVAPFLIDIREPKECAGGVIRGAIVMPGEQVKKRLDRLPAKDIRVTVYDQVGSDEADKLAAWLREQGWGLARRLVGGYAEWIEHAEPVTVPAPPEGGRFAVGQQVDRKKGGRAWVQEAWSEGGKARYTLWLGDGSWVTAGEDELRG